MFPASQPASGSPSALGNLMCTTSRSGPLNGEVRSWMRRMCSCGNPIVCPVSWRTTRWYSDSGVSIVNSCRLSVGSFEGIERMSVPRYDQ